MSKFQPLLAQTILPTDVLPTGWHWMGLTLKELLVLLGAVAWVTVMLFVWAVYFRKKPRRHSHHHRHHSGAEESAPVSVEESDVGESGRRYRRKRRRRRDHRPRNPTLAETGGLPPLRTQPPQDPLP
jgi:hypothetical protein